MSGDPNYMHHQLFLQELPAGAQCVKLIKQLTIKWILWGTPKDENRNVLIVQSLKVFKGDMYVKLKSQLKMQKSIENGVLFP